MKNQEGPRTLQISNNVTTIKEVIANTCGYKKRLKAANKIKFSVNPVIPEQDMISNTEKVKVCVESEVLDIQSQWYKHFAKLQDENNLEMFFDNCMKMKPHARENNVPLQLT